MAFELPADLARRLIDDPVMAAKVLLGAELDHFQKVRLRMMWFTPIFLDHSGVSSAKSETVFIFALLRMMLLPNPLSMGQGRNVAVFYQKLDTAKSAFVDKLVKYAETSPKGILLQQLKRQRSNELYRKQGNSYLVEWRNGGTIHLPAGDFARNSKGEASKRYNDVICDEAGEMDEMGQGIDKMLLARATLQCFNPNHPVWCNHTHFFGHGVSKKHPYYRRFSKIRRKAVRGSQQHAVFCANYTDYQGKFMEKYGQQAKSVADNMKDAVGDSEWAWQWLGEFKSESMGWYSSSLRLGIQRLDVEPELARRDDDTLYFLGWDTAGTNKKAGDYSSGIVVAVKAMLGPPPPGADPVGYMEVNGRWWFFSVVYAVYLFAKTVDQQSGVIHRLHQAFRFQAIAMDSQGGGIFVYQKMRESRQFIDNRWVNLPGGLCLPQEQFGWVMAEPIVHTFDRGDPLFRSMFGEKYLQDNSGPNDFAHRTMRELMGRRSLAWPLTRERRTLMPASSLLTAEQQEVLSQLDRTLAQFGGIGVKVDKDGRPVKSGKGMQQFVEAGKKDGAMATIYAVLRALAEVQKIKNVKVAASPIGFF